MDQNLPVLLLRAAVMRRSALVQALNEVKVDFSKRQLSHWPTPATRAVWTLSPQACEPAGSSTVAIKCSAKRPADGSCTLRYGGAQ